MTSRTTTPAAQGAVAIQAGIALLAAFAFALSYDALRQMAAAIHVRGLLTYAFPLVIDGFIAIGVGALLMLRTAPLASRIYVWTLVGLATTTSIWANALHAVRLNQQAQNGVGLRLDNVTVGGLSAIAPLALAGAVHLYIVIRRHPASRRTEETDRSGTDVATSPIDVAREPVDVARDGADVADVPEAVTEAETSALGSVDAERLAIARSAPLGRGDRASRRHIEDTFRQRELTIGRKEADRLKDLVQAELDTAAQRPDLTTADAETA